MQTTTTPRIVNNNDRNVASILLRDDYITLQGTWDDEADRDAFVATFPKFVKVKATEAWCLDGTKRAAVSMSIAFVPNAVTGEINEAGIKRARRLISILAASDQGLAFFVHGQTEIPANLR